MLNLLQQASTAAGEVTTIGAVSAGIALVLREGVAFLLKGRNGKNGKAGEKPVEYWDGKFDRLAIIAEQQTDILREMKNDLKPLAQGITALLERTK